MLLSAKTEQVIALSGNEFTQTEVAGIVGVSRQRVEQLVRKYGLSFRDGRLGQPLLCSRCGAQTQSKASPPVCRTCLDKGAWIEVPCLTCGEPVRTRRKEMTARQSNSRYRRPFRQEHRACQSNRIAPCCICSTPFRLTPWQFYYIRRMGGRTSCGQADCRDKLRRDHLAKMRAKRWSKRGDGKEAT